MTPKQTSRDLLRTRAYREIKDMILREHAPAGSFLSKRALAKQLEMSPTPVHSALERLEAEGFVRISPQQGIVVREFSIEEVADFFEFRLAIESFVIRAVAGRLTPDQRRLLRENLKAQSDCAKLNDVDAFTRADAEFHHLICAFQGNGQIVASMSELRDKLYRVARSVSTRVADRPASAYKEHKAIADAMIAGDAELAIERLTEHIEFGKRVLIS
jgi:DNA-binding GntR family transcriptional regulator